MTSNSVEAIVLAGGLGTRLREAVPDLPKPMASVAGCPFLAHVLDSLKDQGISRVVLSVGYLAEMIVSHFGNSYRGMEIVYAHEREPLGTGGAIAFALSFVRANRALVLNGDTYLGMDYAAFVSACDAAGATLGIVVRSVPDTSRYGRCELSGNVMVRFSDKGNIGPGQINAGVYCLSRDVFATYPMPVKFSFEQDFVGAYLARLKPLGFPVDGYFIDIGVPEDFLKAQVDFAPRGQKTNSGAAA